MSPDVPDKMSPDVPDIRKTMAPKPPSRFTPGRLADYSESAIIQEIRRVILDECGGIVPTRDEFERLARVTHTTIAKHFGSYSAGIRAAGFETRRPKICRPKITADQVRANLHQVLSRANGYCFSQEFYRTNGGIYCEEVVKARLGVRTWESALAVIGAKKRQRIVHTVVSDRAQRRRVIANATEADLFGEIDRVWRSKGRRPSYKEFAGASRFGIRVFETRYGSWTKAIDAFSRTTGMLIHGLRRSRPTKEILLNELRAVQRKRPGAVLTHDSYRAHGGTYGRSAFVKRFGNWTTAVNAVGGTSGEQARHSRDELFEEVQRLWVQLGRQPTQTEMWKLGTISPKCYSRMFGSWTRAIHAFCDDRNDDSESTAIPAPADCDTVRGAQVSPIAAVDVASGPINPPLVTEHATGRTVSLKVRFQVMKRDQFKCKACGRSPAGCPGLELQVDHVVAYSNGGETVLDNLQTLCKDCNVGKSNLS